MIGFEAIKRRKSDLNYIYNFKSHVNTTIFDFKRY